MSEKLFKKIALISTAVIATAFIILVLVQAFGDQNINIGSFGSDNLEGPELELTPSPDPEGGRDDYLLRVPEERIPEDFSERLVAAPITLLPNHLPTEGSDLEIALTRQEEQKIFQATNDFLKDWETFFPGDNSYSDRLDDQVVDSSMADVLKRVDSHQPPIVCALAECNSGSKWVNYGGAMQNNSTVIRDYDNERVYLTTYGSVKYDPDPLYADQLGGRLFNRAYGIILVREDNKFIVERVVAETIGELY